MIFRPLSIDYRARAQEILLIERDDAARRAARSLLPHHSVNDSNNRNSSLSVDVADDDQSATSSQQDNSPDKVGTVSRPSLQTIYNLLGPAVHPSECALRSISPVSKGPIRGAILPVQKSQRPFLEQLIGQCERIEEEEMRGIVLALESGRSRFQEPMLLDEEDEIEFFGCSGDDSDCDENLFHETMMVLYSKEDHLRDSSGGHFSGRRDMTATNVASNTLRQAPTSAPLFIRHQPPDLNRIHELKNLRTRGESTSFANALCNMFQPELKSLSNEMAVDFPKDGGSGAYIGPKFDPTIFCDASPSLTVDYSRDQPGSFTRFFDQLDSLHNASDEPSSMLSPPSGVLEAFDNIGCFLRIDPELPTDNESPNAKKWNVQSALIKSLDGLCSATFISSKLGLPTRFETGHEILQDPCRFFVAIDCPRFQFFEKAAAQTDALPDCTSFESCLNFIESRDVVDAQHFIPRKISLESDIKLFGEPEEDKAEARPTSNELMKQLPSYASQLSFTPKFIEKGISRQMRHVKSSARVVNATALQSVVDSSCSAPCLFIPQVKVPKRKAPGSSRKLTSNKQDDITHLVRSCVPSGNVSQDLELLRQQNSDYPIKNWSTPNGSHQRVKDIHLSEHQKERNMNTRLAFCEKAQTVSRKESKRILILTGCSSRRNADALYAYRGILTNELVDPQVYAARYALVSKAIKAARASSVSTSHSNFVEMTQNVMIASLLRDGQRKKRGAQLANRLKTSRHGILGVIQETHEPTQLENRVVSMELTTCIREMASFADGGFEVSTGDLIEELGDTLKKERGELLHLVSKADELEKEEKAYLEELAVLNRTSNTAKDDLFDFTVESGRKQRHDATEYKEKVEHDEKKQKKKKRKRDKRKNETTEERAARKNAKKMRKEERKRKSKVDDPSDNQSWPGVSKKAKHNEFIRKEPLPTDAEISLATVRCNVKVAAPSLNLGITPIVPPRLKKSQVPATGQHKVVDNSTKKNALCSVAASHKIKDSTLLSVAKTNSPDSVASLLNEGRKLLFSLKKHNEQETATTAEPEERSKPCELFWGNPDAQDPAELDEHSGKASHMRSRNEVAVDISENKVGASPEAAHGLQTITLLASEYFLESFSEVVAELASGRWTKVLAPHEKIKIRSLSNTNVAICDCPLVDVSGVDVELSAEKGAIIQRLSHWLDHNEGIQKASRLFIKKLVELAASGRYKCLHIIFCTDIEITSMISSDFVTLQNALVQQCGCHCEQVTFEFVRPRVLSATLALHLLSDRSQASVIPDISDDNTIERARFLLMLVPSMTVHTALRCVGFHKTQFDSSSDEVFFNLLNSAKTMERNAFVESKSSILSELSAHQLWLALHVDISHAH